MTARLTLLLLLGACGGPDLDRPHQGPDGPGAVGQACHADPDCQAELICIAELPGGFCSRTCTATCPEGSLCVRTALPDGDEVDACAPLCDSATPCREGYGCIQVGARSVCGF